MHYAFALHWATTALSDMSSYISIRLTLGRASGIRLMLMLQNLLNLNE